MDKISAGAQGTEGISDRGAAERQERGKVAQMRGVGGNAGRTCRISSLQRRQRDRYSVLQRGELKGGSYATPGGSDGKVPAYNAGTLGLTPGG